MLRVERFGERQDRISAEASIDQILGFPESSNAQLSKVVVAVVDNLEVGYPLSDVGTKRSA